MRFGMMNPMILEARYPNSHGATVISGVLRYTCARAHMARRMPHSEAWMLGLNASSNLESHGNPARLLVEFVGPENDAVHQQISMQLT